MSVKRFMDLKKIETGAYRVMFHGQDTIMVIKRQPDKSWGVVSVPNDNHLTTEPFMPGYKTRVDAVSALAVVALSVKRTIT